MSSRHHYRITARSPVRQHWFVRAIRPVVLFVICAGLYVAGVVSVANIDFSIVTQHRSANMRDIDSSKESAALRQEMALLQRQAGLSELLIKQLRVEIEGLVTERADLRREIDFYRRFVERAGTLDGIGVQDLVVARRADGTGYRYRLVLVQNPTAGSMASGTAQLTVETDGEARPISAARAGYEFRYFQLLEGTFDLPQAVRPLAVKVDILPTGGGQEAAVSVSFPWQATS